MNDDSWYDADGNIVINDTMGIKRKLGCNIPQLLSFDGIPAFADSVAVLDRSQLYTRNMRQFFGDAWIADQGSFGSCNGWAGAKALERVRVLSGLPRVRLSGSSLYALINGNRDQGSTLVDGMRTIQLTGCLTEDQCPANRIYANQIDKELWKSAHKAMECYTVSSELELATGLVLGFTAVVAVHADNGFMRLDRDGIAGGGNGPGNHSVCVDGVVVDSGRIRFDMANSWGLGYGERGRAYLTWDQHFDSTIRNHGFYLIRGTVE